MRYQAERDQFIARMTREGLGLPMILTLLRAATTLQRIAELECSSEAADRDRVPCPGVRWKRSKGHAAPEETGLCCCDYDHATGEHRDVPRVTARAARLEARIAKQLAALPVRCAICNEETGGAGSSMHGTVHKYGPVDHAFTPAAWGMQTDGDPRGAVLRVIPPSYQARNKGKDRFNRESIGVPARDSRLRF